MAAAAWLVGCGDGGGGGGSSTPSARSVASGSATTSSATTASTSNASAAPSSSAEVWSPTLELDPSALDGQDAFPPSSKKDRALSPADVSTWVAVAGIEIPVPVGFVHKTEADRVTITPANKQPTIMVATRVGDKADTKKKLDVILASFKLNEYSWSPMNRRGAGPDDIKALAGTGKAKEPTRPYFVGYQLLKGDGAYVLMVMALAGDALREVGDTTMQIGWSVRKKK